MPRGGLVRAEMPALYRRIAFDTALEKTAFRQLAELELEECREAFGRLVEQLDLDRRGSADPAVSLLLLDVLQKVNRRVHRTRSDPAAYEANRASLVEQFSGLGAEEARRTFLPSLNRLLTPLRQRTIASRHLVEAARAYIDEHYARRISLSSVAAHLHVSPNYLSRMFKKETAVNLTRYVHAVRLEHALVLLAAGDRSISEIAYLVGYQNYRDFYRNFVKYKQASPREIQRRLARGLGEEAVPAEGGTA